MRECMKSWLVAELAVWANCDSRYTTSWPPCARAGVCAYVRERVCLLFMVPYAATIAIASASTNYLCHIVGNLTLASHLT